MAFYGINDAYVSDLVDSSSGLSVENLTHFSDIQQLSIDAKTNTEAGYAANRQIDNATMFQNATVGFNVYDLTAAEQAFLLNQSTPSSGGVIMAAEDEGKYKSIFYKAPLRRKKSDGTLVTRYGYIYKCQFTPYKETLKGLEGKPDTSQTPQLEGTAFATDFSYTDEKSRTIHPWHYHIDDDDDNCPSDIAIKWYTKLYVPTYDNTALTVTVVPADAAATVAVGTSVAWTFSKAVKTSAVNAGNFVVIKASDGSAVSGTLSLDTTGKIITFAPSESLSASTAYIAIVTQNVADNYGNALTKAVITNFETAAA
jgi:phi13 family phage major tail protein